MSDPVSLLPPNATAFERAVSLASAARFPLPTHLVRDVARPDLCPSDLLSFLAWAYSVDVWRETWPDEIKRWVIAQSLKHHRLKGTEAGLKLYVDLVGAQVIHLVVPPARFILGRARTVEELERLLGRLPEVRIYPLTTRRPRGKATFFDRSYLTGVGSWHVMANTAFDHHQKRAELRTYAPDTVTQLRIAALGPSEQEADLQPFERLFFPHSWRGAYMLGAGNVRRQRWLGRPTSAEYVVSFRASQRVPGAVAIGRGLRPAQAHPDLVNERHGGARWKFFGGRPLAGHRGRAYLARSDAADYVYQRLRLWDGRRAPGSFRRASYFDHARLGLRAHTAIVSLRVPVPRVPGKFFLGGPMGGVLAAHNGVPLAEAMAAVRASKAAHERHWIDVETFFERRFAGAI